MGRFLVGVVGLVLLAGCGREGAATEEGGPRPGPAAISPATSAVDLEPVEALLADLDRALVESAPADEDDPAR